MNRSLGWKFIKLDIYWGWKQEQLSYIFFKLQCKNKSAFSKWKIRIKVRYAFQNNKRSWIEKMLITSVIPIVISMWKKYFRENKILFSQNLLKTIRLPFRWVLSLPSLDEYLSTKFLFCKHSTNNILIHNHHQTMQHI